MLTKSAKAKGRNLQNWVRDTLIIALDLNAEDITTAIMGEKGADVRLVPNNQYMFNYIIECKSQKTGFSAVYSAMSQCECHPGKGEPLVIIKQDRQRPLAVLDAEYFIKEYRR